jgi:hypothetical protein
MLDIVFKYKDANYKFNDLEKLLTSKTDQLLFWKVKEHIERKITSLLKPEEYEKLSFFVSKLDNNDFSVLVKGPSEIKKKIIG